MVELKSDAGSIMAAEIFTIGHSTQPVERFIELLMQHRINAIADVRSSPYSRRNPQFNREAVHAALRTRGIRYVFLGEELGARSKDECCYVDDKVDYQRLANTPLFQSGIARVLQGAQSHKIALMCAEKEPLDCHRTILVARELVRVGCRVTHILADGSLESHDCAIARLVKQSGLTAGDLFRSQALMEEEAYQRQSHRIAYDRKAHWLPSDPGKRVPGDRESP